MRVGHGFDVHAFSDGATLVIGGVTIEHERGLAGHSDADVLSHAIADALLGAAGLGDLGSNFPADEKWRGASSLDILSETARLVTDAGLRIENVDATVVCEAPRISPHREAMMEKIATALGIEVNRVSVKSTTTDGLGFTGRGDGVAAMAVALLDRV